MTKFRNTLALACLAALIAPALAPAQDSARFVQFESSPTVTELSRAFDIENSARAVVTTGGVRLDKPPAAPTSGGPDIKPTPVPNTWVADQIEFENGSNRILSTQLGLIDLIGSLMQEQDDFVMVVSGHANATGPNAINDRLSKERATAVAQYISSVYSIPETRFELRWMGAREPLPTHAPADVANRRVQFGVVRPQ